jgi:CheY-like chemotaxis protein
MRGRELRVLVVEDEAIIAALIENALIEGGCSVVGPVATLGVALETIEKTRIDAALLDISINGRRTYPIADVLAARGIPFIFVSGFTRKDLPPRYRHCAHIAKPFVPSAIMAALRGVAPPRGSMS